MLQQAVDSVDLLPYKLLRLRIHLPIQSLSSYTDSFRQSTEDQSKRYGSTARRILPIYSRSHSHDGLMRSIGQVWDSDRGCRVSFYQVRGTELFLSQIRRFYPTGFSGSVNMHRQHCFEGFFSRLFVDEEGRKNFVNLSFDEREVEPSYELAQAMENCLAIFSFYYQVFNSE